jgi:hypothetical protein
MHGQSRNGVTGPELQKNGPFSLIKASILEFGKPGPAWLWHQCQIQLFRNVTFGDTGRLQLLCDMTGGSFLPLQPASVSYSLEVFGYEQGVHEPQAQLTQSAKPRVGLGLVIVITTVYATLEPTRLTCLPEAHGISLYNVFFF